MQAQRDLHEEETETTFRLGALSHQLHEPFPHLLL